jgi:hypothetical protein
MPVKEQNGAQGLVLSGNSNLLLYRKEAQEFTHLGFRSFVRMPFAVEKDKPLNPMQIGLFGSNAEVSHPDRISYLFQQF